MRADIPKQYLQLLGRSVLEHTLEHFISHPRITGVMVAISADDEWWPEIGSRLPTVRTTLGGVLRCHSVLNALNTLNDECGADDWMLVHDAARPCVRRTDIDRMIAELADSRDGGILAVPVRDTLKCCDKGGVIEATVDRTHLWHALTPQMFRYGLLRAALTQVIGEGVVVTDEAQAIELLGQVPRVVEGHGDNLKITRPEDLVLAELFLRAQQLEGGSL